MRVANVCITNVYSQTRFLFSSLLVNIPVPKILWDIFFEVHNETNEREKKKKKKKVTDLRCTQLKCGESFSTTTTHIFIKWNLCYRLCVFFSFGFFNGNYDLIASFNVIIGHWQHVNGISIIYMPSIFFGEEDRERKIKCRMKCKLRLFGILMVLQWQLLSLLLKLTLTTTTTKPLPPPPTTMTMASRYFIAILYILNSKANFNGQFTKCRFKWR